MGLNVNDLELLENYFNQTLSEPDKKIFEQRLKTDAAFRKSVNEYQATHAILNTVRQRKKKDFLKGLDADMPPVQTLARQNNSNKWWAIAAVGLLLATVGVWQFSEVRGGGVKLKSPVAGYFEAYPALGITMGDEGEKIKTQALRTYATNDFKKAIPILQKAFETEKDSLLLFYEGIALLGNGEASKAQSVFETLQSSKNLPTEAVNWYLALALIEIGKKESALPILKKLSETENEYKEKSIKLILDLEKKN